MPPRLSEKMERDMSIFKRGRTYWFHFVFNGDHVQKSTKQGNPRVARQIEAAERTRLAKGEVGIRDRKPVLSFSAAMKEFLAWSELEHAAHERTHRRYKTSSVALLRHFQQSKLDAISPEGVERFKTERASQSGKRTRRLLRPATINRELACGKALFNFALKADPRLVNPFRNVRFLPENNEQMLVGGVSVTKHWFPDSVVWGRIQKSV